MMIIELQIMELANFRQGHRDNSFLNTPHDYNREPNI
jgi:hypothetical protein